MSATELALREQGLDAGAFDLAPLRAARDHEVLLRPVAAQAFEAMRLAAAHDGVVLLAVSGYRSVPRQEEIWNAKFAKARAEGASEEEALRRNLVYSAPPGWSRHHWGTDLDLVDGALDAEARLESEDWQEGGCCRPAGRWLDEHAADFGFLRPYDVYRGGFSAEPWHWSFAPPAIAFLPRMRRIDWHGLFRAEPWSGAALMAPTVDRDFARFVLGIQPRLRVATSR